MMIVKSVTPPPRRWERSPKPTPNQTTLEALLKAAEDDNPSVRAAAANALGELAKANPSLATKTLEALLKAAGDRDPDVRKAAASALGELAKAAPSLAPKTLE
ncbi:MAG: sister chromatid cohesion protein PDS5, partial [Bacteroidota bacterium]